MFRLFILLVVLSLSAFGQMKMTVAQLKSFISSSKQLKHDDKKVAEYLKKFKMAEKLEDSTIDELLASGAGQRTAEVLREMRDASKALPAAKTVPVAVVNEGPGIPPPSTEEQRKILRQATEFAMNYTKQLPHFTCVQITRRFYDPSGLEFWQRADVLNAKLSFFELKETYKLMSINGQIPKLDISMDQVGGSTSSGEFGSLLKMVFEDKTYAKFQWERWGKLRGRLAHVYSFYIAQPNSGYMLVYEKTNEYKPALRGTIFVDNDTQMILRLAFDAVDLPPSFPIQGTNVMLDYDFQTLTDQTFLLPLRAELKSRSGKLLTKNEIEFRLYQRFGADINIKFDVPDALPESQTKEQPIKP